MAQTRATATIQTEAGSGSKLAAHFARNRIAWVGGALIVAVALALRIYLDTMAFSVGTDYYSPEFQIYWMPLLYGEVIVLGLFTVIASVYFWMTRETDASAISKELELSRYFKLLGVFTVMGLWAASIALNAVESDAAWHQVTIRDTDFTPTHIIIFYFALPFLTAMLIPTFIYAHTRLPAYMNKISVPFLVVVCGILMIMPNYGFNEWGHTFFYAEELFAAPIHWGFVILGWSLFFFVPLAVQLFTNMGHLIAEVTAEKKQQAV
ncbi:MAG: methane monooxygenase/ammonia monooxygenase subunit C [Porticoccaceae bacterium]